MDLLGTVGLTPAGALWAAFAALVAALGIALWTAGRRSRSDSRTVIRLND